MKTTENCFGIGSYASSVFFMGLFCVWTLFNPPLPVFVCFPRRLCAHLCFLHSLVYLSPCFFTLSYTLVFPCPPRHPLCSLKRRVRPQFYIYLSLSFLLLWILDFELWTSSYRSPLFVIQPAYLHLCLRQWQDLLPVIKEYHSFEFLCLPELQKKTSLGLNLAKRQRRCPHSRNDDIVCFRKFPQNSKCFMPLQQPQRSITVLGGTDEICSPAQASDQQIGF